jgi:hypothetical protein
MSLSGVTTLESNMGTHTDTHSFKSNQAVNDQHCANIPSKNSSREDSRSTETMTTGPAQIFPDDSTNSAGGGTSFQRTSQQKRKLPIPRSTTFEISTKRGRVSQACDYCRQQKTKCSGNRPTCQQCEASALQCLYSCRKREKIEQ